MVCASEGSVQALEAILAAKPELNATDSTGRTALHFACRAGNVAVGRLLMQQAGAQVDKQTNGGMTPLMSAVESGNAEMLRECIEHGANLFK